MSQPTDLVTSPEGVATEVFVPPTKEMQWLARLLRGLVVPRNGEPGRIGRLFGQVVIAPFTQFTVFNFDLQAFLFRVFHVSFLARLSHGLFMPVVVFFLMVFFAQFRTGGLPAEQGWQGVTYSGAYGYALFLCLWYLGLAIMERFYLWWLLTIPLVFGLAAGADWYFCQTVNLQNFSWYQPTELLYNPLIWMFVAAHLVALGHAAENVLPPRALNRWCWVDIPEAILGTDDNPKSLLQSLHTLAMIVVQLIGGTLNEWWASPRLMPYNWLMMMFARGYKKEKAAEIKAYADKALASGNPAVDYVGIGGGAYLKQDILK